MTAPAVIATFFYFFGEISMQNQPTFSAKSALHITKRRTVAIGLAMTVFALYLAVNLFRLQIGKYDYYREKVFDQITTTSSLKARRGAIYDSDMNLLATHGITWRVFLSTKQIKAAIKESGISLVIARSFARIFYRNSINIGLAIVECSEAVDGISEGDIVEADLDAGIIYNRTTGKQFETKPFPTFIQKIIENGGLVESIKSGVIR